MIEANFRHGLNALAAGIKNWRRVEYLFLRTNVARNDGGDGSSS